MLPRIVTLAAALTLVSLPAPTLAGPDRFSVLLGSHHVGASGFEEINPGVFLTWQGAAWQGNLDLGFGAFRNSYGNGSLAVTTAYPLIRTPDWGIDLFGALAWYPGDGDQFSHAIGDIVPLGGLQGRYRNIFVQAIPGGGGSVDATLTYGLTFELD